LRGDAAAEAERIAAAARAEGERLRAAAAAEPVEPPDRDSRLRGARRAAAERLAREDAADRREALEAREEWIGRAVQEGRRRLSSEGTAEDRRSILARLAAEAISHLPGEEFQVVVRREEATLLDEDWRRNLAAACGKRALDVVADGTGDGGCLVRTSDGTVGFDNRYEARARRFERAWRAALSAIWES
jgi:vacuolar-type H+-ATPase subunit E/Vma4